MNIALIGATGFVGSAVLKMRAAPDAACHLSNSKAAGLDNTRRPLFR